MQIVMVKHKSHKISKKKKFTPLQKCFAPVKSNFWLYKSSTKIRNSTNQSSQLKFEPIKNKESTKAASIPKNQQKEHIPESP